MSIDDQNEVDSDTEPNNEEDYANRDRRSNDDIPHSVLALFHGIVAHVMAVLLTHVFTRIFCNLVEVQVSPCLFSFWVIRVCSNDIDKYLSRNVDEVGKEEEHTVESSVFEAHEEENSSNQKLQSPSEWIDRGVPELTNQVKD